MSIFDTDFTPMCAETGCHSPAAHGTLCEHHKLARRAMRRAQTATQPKCSEPGCRSGVSLEESAKPRPLCRPHREVWDRIHARSREERMAELAASQEAADNAAYLKTLKMIQDDAYSESSERRNPDQILRDLIDLLIMRAEKELT